MSKNPAKVDGSTLAQPSHWGAEVGPCRGVGSGCGQLGAVGGDVCGCGPRVNVVEVTVMAGRRAVVIRYVLFVEEHHAQPVSLDLRQVPRSEERRVRKECRSR